VHHVAEPISRAVDGSTAAHGPSLAAVAPAVATAGGVGLDQVADLGGAGEMLAAADMDGTTAAVSTRAGPEADPYHLGGGIA
jgi:hypothetical protein